MPERRMNQPETAHSQMNRLRNRSDFSEGADGSRSLDNFNTPPQPSFDSEEMRGSMQAILAQNIGEYVVIEFLIGTENIVRKQGMLYFVGRSFVTLYDEHVNNFIVCDIFSVTCRDNFPSRVGEFVIRIGDHCFYDPTPAYAET